MTDLERFVTEVEAYIAAHRMTPTQFGMMFAGDPKFVFDLRAGREPRTATRQRILDAMREAVAEPKRQAAE